MSSYEFTGKSVKEAIARACKELKIDEALLDIEVLEESSKGFLGIVGHREARVRVKPRDILQEVKEAEPSLPPISEENNLDRQANPATPEETELEAAITDREEPAIDPVPYVGTAEEVLRKLLERMAVTAEVNSAIIEGSVYLDIKGDGSGLLIGKKGQTLDALQFIVNKIVNKPNSPNRKVDIIVDTENYRERKKENLREIAIKAGEKAKKMHKPVPL